MRVNTVSILPLHQQCGCFAFSVLPFSRLFCLFHVFPFLYVLEMPFFAPVICKIAVIIVKSKACKPLW